MRKTIILLAIAGAIGTALLLSSANAALPPPCTCNTPLQVTPMVWGSGATCSAAFLDALTQARALTNCGNGVCSENVVVDTPCWFNAIGDAMVDLHLEYQCYQCGLLFEAEAVAMVAEPASSN